MTLHIICVAYNRPVPLRILIDCFILQTNTKWKLHIVHDGPATEAVRSIIKLYNDRRIYFTETSKRLNQWGHPNRKMMLHKLKGNKNDYVLITNDDNYYMAIFVDLFLSACKDNKGMVYCDTIHNYLNYDILNTELRVNAIDMGSFIVRLDVAQLVGFNHMVMEADGLYAEECAATCKYNGLDIVYIKKPLFVHN